MKSVITLRRVVMSAVLLGSAIALSAAPEPGRVAVHYQDLDLSQSKDASVLYGRISKAARQVCQQPGLKETWRWSQYKQCYEMAVSNAVDQVDETTLTALHQAHVQKARAS